MTVRNIGTRIEEEWNKWPGIGGGYVPVPPPKSLFFVKRVYSGLFELFYRFVVSETDALKLNVYRKMVDLHQHRQPIPYEDTLDGLWHVCFFGLYSYKTAIHKPIDILLVELNKRIRDRIAPDFRASNNIPQDVRDAALWIITKSKESWEMYKDFVRVNGKEIDQQYQSTRPDSLMDEIPKITLQTLFLNKLFLSLPIEIRQKAMFPFLGSTSQSMVPENHAPRDVQLSKQMIELWTDSKKMMEPYERLASILEESAITAARKHGYFYARFKSLFQPENQQAQTVSSFYTICEQMRTVLKEKGFSLRIPDDRRWGELFYKEYKSTCKIFSDLSKYVEQINGDLFRLLTSTSFGGEENDQKLISPAEDPYNDTLIKMYQQIRTRFPGAPAVDTATLNQPQHKLRMVAHWSIVEMQYWSDTVSNLLKSEHRKLNLLLSDANSLFVLPSPESIEFIRSADTEFKTLINDQIVKRVIQCLDSVVVSASSSDQKTDRSIVVGLSSMHYALERRDFDSLLLQALRMDAKNKADAIIKACEHFKRQFFQPIEKRIYVSLLEDHKKIKALCAEWSSSNPEVTNQLPNVKQLLDLQQSSVDQYFELKSTYTPAAEWNRLQTQISQQINEFQMKMERAFLAVSSRSLQTISKAAVAFSESSNSKSEKERRQKHGIPLDALNALDVVQSDHTKRLFTRGCSQTTDGSIGEQKIGVAISTFEQTQLTDMERTSTYPSLLKQMSSDQFYDRWITHFLLPDIPLSLQWNLSSSSSSSSSVIPQTLTAPISSTSSDLSSIILASFNTIRDRYQLFSYSSSTLTQSSTSMMDTKYDSKQQQQQQKQSTLTTTTTKKKKKTKVRERTNKNKLTWDWIESDLNYRMCMILQLYSTHIVRWSSYRSLSHLLYDYSELCFQFALFWGRRSPLSS